MQKRPIPALLLITLLLLPGCAGLDTSREQPRVNLVNLQVIDMQLFEQRYGLTLRVQNPDRSELVVEGLNFELELNGREFAYGVSRQDVAVPGFGEALLEVEVVSTLFNVVDQLRDLEQRQGKSLSYRIHGKIALRGNLISIPFEQKGVLGGNSSPAAPSKEDPGQI